LAGVQPALDRMRARGQVGTRGVEGDEPATATAGTEASEEIGTRALKRDVMTQPIREARPSLSGVAQPTTASSSQAIQSVGTADPAITSLSVAQGQPGEPVMITGGGFSDGGGEVHFVIAPGRDLVAPAGVVWRNDQIFVTVPDASGVLGFNGTVYVVRASDKKMSNLVAFRFNPAMELREVRATMDRVLKWPVDEESPADEIRHFHGNPFVGFKDNDVLFGHTRLKNGWVTDEAFVHYRVSAAHFEFGSAGAYVWEIKKGTDWPYLNVRWWVDAGLGGERFVEYRFAVRLIGPKGVPDGLVVP
jgi:hypothetical protein